VITEAVAGIFPWETQRRLPRLLLTFCGALFPLISGVCFAKPPPPQTEADIADTREQDRLPLNNLVDGEPLTGKSGERPSPRSHPGQLEQEISRGEKLDYWVREITAPSRQTLDGMLQIGARILEAEASGLSHEEIRQLQEKRLPFSSSDYSKYRNIAAHEGIIDPSIVSACPWPAALFTCFLSSHWPPLESA